ncbi:hypothetical protein OROHE_019188 [Orobanche hederae]
MTSASELFYNRRSRFGRGSDPLGVESDFGLTPHIDRSNRRHRRYDRPGGNHTRRDRIDPESCDPFRRDHHHHHQRQPPQRRPSHPPQEHESTRLEENDHQFSSGNVGHSRRHVSIQDRPSRVGVNDRLPGAVLLARERLLQRLRGVTLSNSRRSNIDIAIGGEFRLVDYGDWEIEASREWLATAVPLTNSVGQQATKRPAGLTQEAVSRLCIEVFVIPSEETREQQGLSGTIRECSICLENFSEGDELICLPCEHRYHSCCLEPWVRTCGDCPYCRRGIDVNLDRVEDNPDC